MEKKTYFLKNIISAARVLTISALLSLALFSCNSVPDEIPEDLDARQLIQLGQDNYDSGRYKASEAYFSAVLERFGDDAKHYVEATYELGHLYMKTKEYEKAYKNFTEILDIYERVPAGLPGAYRKLSEIELKKIPQAALDQITGGSNKEAEE